MRFLTRKPSLWQLRLRYVWITRSQGLTTVWLQVAGRKPLAHLPKWRRRLLHLPSVRWRLWPRPWNFNGPVVGYRSAYREILSNRNELYFYLSRRSADLPEEMRREFVDQAEQILFGRTSRG